MDDQLGQQIILKLLDWPVLAFLIIVLVTLVFRRQIGAAVKRGDVLISWGENRSIGLSQLSKGLDQELDPIRDEIEGLKAAVAALEAERADPTLPAVQPIGPPPLPDARWEAARSRMHDALADGNYTWRSIDRLAILGGVSRSQALDILRADPAVVLSVGKSNRQIARLAARAP